MTVRSLRSPSARLAALVGSDKAGGYVLMGAAALALVLANSPAAGVYFAALEAKLGPLSTLHWINDALMAVFFLLVGLEIKREILEGQLSSPARMALPGIAALGGVIAPALIYLALNRADPVAARGWAVPTATDIAFVLGIVAMLGPRVPPTLKVLLTAIAILDDLVAIAVIALFYSAGIAVIPLALAGLILLTLIGLNRFGVKALWPYLLLGIALWVFVLQSGIHATLAGVALAFTIPAQSLHRLEHALHRPVGLIIVPIFGLANAGVSLGGIGFAAMAGGVPLGVALGLLLGKQFGIFGAILAAVRLGIAPKPAGASLRQLYGCSLLCGIGFTMSLFIGQLAFPTPELVDQTKIGVLGGSIVAALLGTLVLLQSPAGAGGGRVAGTAAGGLDRPNKPRTTT